MWQQLRISLIGITASNLDKTLKTKVTFSVSEFLYLDMKIQTENISSVILTRGVEHGIENISNDRF